MHEYVLLFKELRICAFIKIEFVTKRNVVPPKSYFRYNVINLTSTLKISPSFPRKEGKFESTPIPAPAVNIIQFALLIFSAIYLCISLKTQYFVFEINQTSLLNSEEN